MFVLRALIALCITLPSLALGLTMDWSGFIREEFYAQKSDRNMYGNYYLVLQPELQIADRFSVVSSLELSPSYIEDFFTPSTLERRAGVVFFHHPSLGEDFKPASLLFMRVSQFYFNIGSEFFRFRFGKAPYHFGLGITYNDGRDPSHYWFSSFNQAALSLEYSSFYLKPVLLQNQDNLLILIQAGVKNPAGMKNSSWKLEGLYRYDQALSQGFAEVYGEYLKNRWDAKVSVSYLFTDELTLGIAAEGSVKTSFSIPSQFEFKGGMASKNFSFHPNYDVAFLLWNRLISRTKDSAKILLQDIQINDVAYFSPAWKVKLYKNRVSLRPALVLGWLLTDKVPHYELDLRAQYNFSRNSSVSLTGGLLYKDQKSDYGVLAQVAVTF